MPLLQRKRKRAFCIRFAKLRIFFTGFLIPFSDGDGAETGARAAFKFRFRFRLHQRMLRLRLQDVGGHSTCFLSYSTLFLFCPLLGLHFTFSKTQDGTFLFIFYFPSSYFMDFFNYCTQLLYNTLYYSYVLLLYTVRPLFKEKYTNISAIIFCL